MLILQAHGFERYEISAFCQPNKQAHHNLNYWLFGDYYGIGAGAHGKLTTATQAIMRTRKHRQPSDYLAKEKPYLAAIEQVGADDMVFEFMLNTSRLNQSIPLSLFSDRTNLNLDALLPKLILAQQKGLVTIDHDAWQVTPMGRRYTNDLQALFLPD